MKLWLDGEGQNYKEKELTIHLKRVDNCIDVMAYDRYTKEDWHLLTFHPNGDIRACKKVPRSVGFVVNWEGQVEVTY